MFSLPQLLLDAHHLPNHSTLHFLYLFKKSEQTKKTVKQKMSKHKERKKETIAHQKKSTKFV